MRRGWQDRSIGGGACVRSRRVRRALDRRKGRPAERHWSTRRGLVRRWSRNLSRGSLMARLLGMKLAPDMKANFRKARIGSHRIGLARPAEWHVEHLLDAARPRAHHRDAIAQQDRL